MRHLAFSILGIIFWTVALTQKDFHFETFTTRDGLSHNEVRALFRDSRGYLWVGTANGLNRFDGYEFEVFLPEAGSSNSLGGEAISALAEGPDGGIWIAHNRGINIYYPEQDSFIQVAPHPKYASNWSFTTGCSIYIDDQGYVVISRDGPYLLYFRPGSLEYERLAVPGLPENLRPESYRRSIENGVTAVTYKGPGEVWASSLFGLFSLKLSSRKFTYHELKGCQLEFGPGAACQDDKRGKLWFTVFQQDLFSLDLSDGTCRPWGCVPSNFISSNTEVALTPDGGVWMSQPGLLYPEEEKFIPIRHVPDDPYSFPAGSPSAAYTDKEGILWIGTSAGLAKLDPRLQGFRHVLLEEHPPLDYDNSVFEIFENPEDGLYYITSFYANLIFVFDPATGKSRDISREFRPAFKNSPTRIYRDSYGLTWLLADGRLYQAELGQRRLRAIEMPPLPEGVTDRATFNIVEDAKGGLWITKWRAGVLHYKREKGQLHYVSPPDTMAQPRTTYSIAASPNGNTIWIGTRSEGLFSIDINTGEWSHTLEVQGRDGAISMLETAGLETDESGNVWLACRHGLVRYDGHEEARLFSRADGLANTLLEGMGKDKKGRLWVTSGSGISSINPKTLAIYNYDERHGLKQDATLDGFSVGLNGELFSGTKRGFIRFHPDSLPTDERPPSLALVSFRVGGIEYRKDGRKVHFGDELRLRPSENFFSIAYTALNFTLPEETTFYYKMEGLNEEWIEAGRDREANFTKVPPGRYRFCLKAKNKDGVWSSGVQSFGITVAPPFWRTPWFITLLLSTFTGMGIGAYRFRIQQVRREEQMKTEFNKKLAEVEMAALRSQMNPHFLFNCLNSINRFIQRNEPDEASAYLTKFSRLIRLVLDNSRSDIVSLRDELEALRLYVELEAMRFVGRFSYKIEIASDLDTSSIEVPPMLIQPYVENAIWHGLMHREGGGGLLSISAYEQKGRLYIEVEDNGVGRKMARELKSKSATLHKSHGMKVTAERIEIINEIYEAEATVQIEDLYHENGKAAGTKVKLSLPLK